MDVTDGRTKAMCYSDVMMSTMASQITGGSIVYSNVCSGIVLAQGPITLKMFPFYDVIIEWVDWRMDYGFDYTTQARKAYG